MNRNLYFASVCWVSADFLFHSYLLNFHSYIAVPQEFQDILHRYTIQGYRVIAVAYKKLDPKLTWHQAQRVSRYDHGKHP